MLVAPWIIDGLTQVVIFLVSCSCCAGARKPPNPMLEKENRCCPVIEYAESPEEQAEDWDIVEAQEAELFGIFARPERLHY